MARIQFALSVEKADENGYYAVLQSGENQRTVCRTTLPEIVGWFADHAGGLCKESPYLPPQPQPYKQRSMDEPDPTDPELADKMAERFSPHGGGNGNGRLAIVAFLWCSLASIAMSGLA